MVGDDRDVALDGMYISENNVYVVLNNGHYIEKNGIQKNDGNSQVYTYASYNRLSFGFDDVQLFWYNENSMRKSSPAHYVKTIKKQTILDGMQLLANDYKREFSDNYVKTFNNYITDVKNLLNGNIDKLPLLSKCEQIKNSVYYKYSKEQYVYMSLYLEAAKSLGDNAYNEFVNKPYVLKCLFDMSFDHNGMCTKFEEKVTQNQQSGIKKN